MEEDNNDITEAEGEHAMQHEKGDKEDKERKLSSPYNKLMIRIQEALKRHEEDVDYIIVRGFEPSPGDDDYREWMEREENNEKIDVHTLTQEQVDRFRIIILSERALEYKEENEKKLAGSQHGATVMIIDTSFSYQMEELCHYTDRVIREYFHTPRPRYRVLLPIHLALHKWDVWMYDNEFHMEDDPFVLSFMAKLGQWWKEILSRPDEELGIDSEFTRPGLVAFLEDFRRNIHDRMEGVIFEYE